MRGPRPAGRTRASVLAGVGILALLLAHPALAGRPKPMKPLYQLDRAAMPYIEGTEYPLEGIDDRSPVALFAVPEKNAVGTNALLNGISLFRLENGKAEFELVSRDFKRYASGGDMVFLPQFSDDTIGYSQTRLFLLFNIRNQSFNQYIIGKILETSIDDVAVIDGTKRLFLFQINLSTGVNRKVKLLQLMDLSTSEAKEVASTSIDDPPFRTVLGRTTFHFSEQNGRRWLRVLDDRLRPAQHPLFAVYNDRDHARPFDLPSVHPDLPFALFSESEPAIPHRLRVWSASWKDPGKKVEMFQVLGNVVSGDFRYSPDGKWILFSDASGGRGSNAFVVMPVDPALASFVGSPILLRSNEEMPEEWNGRCAWISDPLSVVCAFEKEERSGEPESKLRTVHKLVRWEISAAPVRRKK